MNPYRRLVEQYLNSSKDITVDRHGAASVAGKVHDVGDELCVIKRPSGDEGAVYTHIAYRDIRGVSITDWDLDT